MVERRSFLLGLGLAAVAGGAVVDSEADAAPVDSQPGTFQLGGRRIRFVDLTHELTDQFNFAGSKRIVIDPIVGSGFAAGMNLNRLLLVEHTGTHIDAPRHFARQGASLGEIPLSDLIVPLAVIDLRARAAADPDVALMPDDILRWERAHGRLPEGCCVAINTGADPVADMREPKSPPVRRSAPGFSLEAAQMLAEARSVKSIAVDSMTLDRGSNVPAYPVHQFWLSSGRWGVEGITNLAAVPPAGAVLIVGAAPVRDATGFPVRLVALF